MVMKTWSSDRWNAMVAPPTEMPMAQPVGTTKKIDGGGVGVYKNLLLSCKEPCDNGFSQDQKG